ncbi:MAG: hypothetical protein DHS20C17_32360 [Cyclobacteriaceae bacterium]|nr:MAG: hypothetical protein DHS20C17_32360 [Cyclobacteriaceae bacterium]
MLQLLKSALLLLLLLGAGCSTVNPDGTISRHYFGYVKVIIPGTKGDVSAVDITTVGLRIGKGIGLGYLHDYRLAAPLDCRIVVIVKNQNQLDHAVNMLSKMEENLCVAVQP